MKQTKQETSSQIGRVPSKKHQPKAFAPVVYGQKIYIKNLSKQGSSLWGRGFIDKNIYLSNKKQQIQSQFTIQPKKGLYIFQGKTITPVSFGAQVLIKHVLSQQYVSIGQNDEMPILEFKKQQSSSCYFQLIPSRTFQSNGNNVTNQSIFQLFNTQSKLYLIDDFQEIQSQLPQPTSPNSYSLNISKRTSQDTLLTPMSLEHKPYVGSAFQIPNDNDQFRQKQQLNQSQFKKKILIKKIQPCASATIQDHPRMITKRSQIQGSTIHQQKRHHRLTQNNNNQGFLVQRTSSLQTQILPDKHNTQHKQKQKIIPFHKVQSRKQSQNNTNNNGNSIHPLLNSLPIYNKEKNIVICGIQNYPYSSWKIQPVKTQLKTQYLNNNDYIYFTHSQANQIMILDIQKSTPQISFIKNTNQSQNQYILSSIFVVQIEKKSNTRLVYLKHLLTGRYFPPGKDKSQKKNCELIPLLSPKKNQYPPFNIVFGGQKLKFEKKTDSQRKQDDLHGFWLNKIPKTQIAQIMSIQNVDVRKSTQYLKQYLKTNTRRRQKILRQFLFIPRLISLLAARSTKQKKLNLNQKQQKQQQNAMKSYYQLLFSICRNNEKNKKQCLKYIEIILSYPRKQQILDLLTQLLTDNTNFYLIQKSITPNLIQDKINQFIQDQGYSISFMRIFRVFCGPDQQPSIRNQTLLFNLFFWGDLVQSGQGMTQSVYQTQKKTKLPNKFKFKIFYDQTLKTICVNNGSQISPFQKLQWNVVNYLRQYLYLLSDCLNGNNYPLIRKFTQQVSFQLLLKLIQYDKLKSPALSLMFNAYLKPQKKYKPYIFHKDYQKICQKGQLISYCNHSEQKLKKILDKQIRQNHLYTQTQYRILLNVFKLTIQSGYWGNFQQLADLMNNLDGVIQQPQSQNTYHDTYEQKVSDRNLLKSKITAISIKIALIDMQVSLWASDFISGIYTQTQIQNKIITQIRNNKNWIIQPKILKLCSTSSPQLLRKAILLMYKIYNLYKLTHKTYQQAIIQSQSKLELKSLFEVLQLKQQMTSDNYFTIISACVKDPINYSQLNPKYLQKNYGNLQSMFKYKQVNQQVQNMTYKLCLHESIINDIKRYTTLIKKLKQQQQDIIYWKLLTLYAMIRNNSKIRDIISQHRRMFISIIQSDSANYYVAVDIIEEIYRNNRKLIISDNEQLKELCRIIEKIFRNVKTDLKYSKVINLLGVFIETGNRKIGQNHQIILQNVFTKSFVNTIVKITMKTNTQLSRKQSVVTQNKQDFYRQALQIVIYDLLVTMGQKKLLSYLDRPSNKTIYTLLLAIGNTNWSLKGKAFYCINFSNIKQDQVLHFMMMILFDLNVMCQSMIISHQEQKQSSKEVKIYISNLTKILDTIQHLFKACSKKLQKQESEEEILVIKIIERLFLLKILCPEIVQKKIKNLLIFINIFELRLKRKNQFSDLSKTVQKIYIGDFQRSQIKDKLPLIFSDKIKNKVKRQVISPLQHKNSILQQTLKKKGKITDLNKYAFAKALDKNTQQQLKNLILSLSNMNKSDSNFLSDNIKQFFIQFLKTSFLQCDNSKLVQRQDTLVKFQAPTIVCSILQQPFKHRYKLLNSTFQLGIRLLQGGHTACQQKFLQKFKQDSKNWIFQNIHQIIIDSLTTIQFYYHYKQDPTIKSYQMMLQLQQYYKCKQQRKLSCQLLSNSFRFLQLLCQNDNHFMKQYIYNQLDKQDHIKYMSKNFIELAQRILDGVLIVIQFNINQLDKMPNTRFQQQVRSNIFNLPVFILDFLIQVCQIPADQNQLYLCHTDFLDFIKKLINLRENTQNKYINVSQKDWSIFFIFERKLIILLKSLLEQNSQQIADLMKKKIGYKQFTFFIQESLTHGGLKDTQKLKQMLKQMQLNGYVQNIVDVLIIKKILKNQQHLYFKSDDPLHPEQKNQQKDNIVNQLNNRIQSIHVDFKSHSLTVYFPFHPLFSLLSRKTKDFMLDRSANQTTRRQKLTQLFSSRQVIYQDINHQKNSQKRMMNQQKMQYLFDFSLFLCFLIVFLLVLFYSVGKSGAVLDIYQVQIISGLSYMQLIVSIIYSLLLGFNLYPIVKQKIRAQNILKKRQQNYQQQKQSNFYTKFLPYFHRIKTIYLDQPQSAHATILLIISIYSCFVQVRVYSFSLIFVFAKIQLLQSILKSIRLTWQQLIFVSLLALAFSFIFGFITLNNYIGPLYQNQQIDIDIDRINQHCNSIITCVSSLYTQKIIGQSVSRQDQQYNYGRFISDLIYWGFFQILLSNIIAAIIIDKFAEQRNVKQKILHDRYSKCYICFADRTTLERRGLDFMTHVDKVHSLWNYFFYMYTLEYLKDITEFTGIQYWINRQVKLGLIDWIPIDVSFKDDDVDISTLIQKLRPYLQDKDVEEK